MSNNQLVVLIMESHVNELNIYKRPFSITISHLGISNDQWENQGHHHLQKQQLLFLELFVHQQMGGLLYSGNYLLVNVYIAMENHHF